MKYRTIKTMGFESSLLGFGAMRLPVSGDDSGSIDEKAAIEMIRYGIDNGINYIDTAYPYHKGNSEILVGKALKSGYRERVKLVTKLPVWLIKKKSDFDKYLDEQLKRLDTDIIDIYLFHSLNEKYWNTILEHDLLSSMQNAVKDKRIKNIGFSFHSSVDVFKRIIDSYDWDICMIQYNYLDIENQAGTEGLKYAHSKNIPIAVMEPLRGGNLVNSVPNDIKQVFSSSRIKRSLAAWAFGWLIGHEEISVILSGMGSLEQVKENLSIFENHVEFDKGDEKIIKRVYDMFHKRQRALCTSCGYCEICPNNIMISTILSLYDDFLIFEDQERSKRFYSSIIKAGKDISRCSYCRKCEEICPQGLKITDLLKEADNILK